MWRVDDPMSVAFPDKATAPPVTVCTIAARNYLAQVRVLAQSLRRFHPDFLFCALIVDAVDGGLPQEEGIEFLYLGDIGLERSEASRMATLYDATEFSTAVKPWLLRSLQGLGCTLTIYLDPDIEIFGSLSEIPELAQTHSIVLTPHLTAPMPDDDLQVREDAILGAGIFNLGFLALGPGSEDFLQWWSGKLRRQCFSDMPRMRFTDQRWVDFVPGLYRHYVLRDAGCNVAYWNLYSRPVAWNGNGFEVSGKPLRFFHYSGFDPNRPHLLSRHQGDRPRIRLSEHAALDRICRDYRGKLMAAGWEEAIKQPYFFGFFENGVPLDHYARRAYRNALLEFDAGRNREPPHPFQSGGSDEFWHWLKQPCGESSAGVTRYILAIHQTHLDLVCAFPDPLGNDAQRFVDWCREGAEARGAQASLYADEKSALKPASRESCISAEIAARQSVTVSGYLTAELGVGEAARLVIDGLEKADVSVQTRVIRAPLSRQNHPLPPTRNDRAGGDINIFCVNADATPGFLRDVASDFVNNRSIVGFWFWEIEEFPEEMHRAFDLVDEVWVGSEFTRQALLRVSPKPVYKFALPRPEVELSNSEEAGARRRDHEFVFLFCFDCLSVMRRKNPDGLVEAYRKAFPEQNGTRLVIKTINGHHQLPEMERLRYLARDRSDISIQDGYLSAAGKNAMIRACDCYVSLHRAEGYGLTMTEAMTMGKPVIATGYSGNSEYMTQANSFLCPFEYGEVGAGSHPYPPTARWAEPDLTAACELMRQVYLDRDEAKRRGRQAAHDMQTLYAPQRCGEAMRRRLEVIRQERWLG